MTADRFITLLLALAITILLSASGLLDAPGVWP